MKQGLQVPQPRAGGERDALSCGRSRLVRPTLGATEQAKAAQHEGVGLLADPLEREGLLVEPVRDREFAALPVQASLAREDPGQALGASGGAEQGRASGVVVEGSSRVPGVVGDVACEGVPAGLLGGAGPREDRQGVHQGSPRVDRAGGGDPVPGPLGDAQGPLPIPALAEPATGCEQVADLGPAVLPGRQGAREPGGVAVRGSVALGGAPAQDRVLADADEQGEAAVGRGLDQGGVAEVLEQVQGPGITPVADHRLCGGHGEPVLEDGQGEQGVPGLVAEQVPAPVEGTAQAGLPRLEARGPGAQQPEALVQSGQDLPQVEQADPGGRELEGQGQGVELGDQAGQRGIVGAGVGPPGAGAGEEELGGFVVRQRRELGHLLALHTEHPAGGGQDPQARSHRAPARQHLAGVGDLLEVVGDEQQGLPAGEGTVDTTLPRN